MLNTIRKTLRTLTARVFKPGRRWAKRTLVVGPAQPVDGDSVACTAALLAFLRKKGYEAYTLPTLAMYRQIDWILTRDDVHPACHRLMNDNLTTADLQAAYDAMLAEWRPDEVVVVDGHLHGFDTRGVPTYLIDHHIRQGVGEVDDKSAYIKAMSSAGCILIERFGITEPILAVSLLTDTFWFRQNLPVDAIMYMNVLRENGLTNQLLTIYQKRLMVHKDSRILAAMRRSDLRFACNGEAAFVVLDEADPEMHRGVAGELGYFCHHMCVVRGDGYVSFRTSDERCDLRPLARKYGRGGHPTQAAGQVDIHDDFAIEALFHDFVQTVAPFEVQEPANVRTRA